MTEIRLYDTATRQKQVLRPLDPSNVRMYVCGPTVYDRAHIGNARPVVVFDVLFRLLRHVYGEGAVTYVRNFTDVDDKINRRAAETRGEDESTLDAIRRISDETIGWYREDMAALGALTPTHEPRATDYVSNAAQRIDMVRMIRALIERGCAYEAEGHVLFDVAAYPAYGRLSRRPLDEMEAGARVEVAPYKRSPLDFVLWKPSDETLPGWESPWGRGRPGWHIECSAMSKALLGERFDIHGGGIDLAFPHHENELAQSCCANDADQMASIWMHNGYLMVEGDKMSKSLGNFFTVHDVRERLSGDVIRYVLLRAHYRSPLDWTEERVEEAKSVLNRWIKLHGRFRRSNIKLPERLRPDEGVVEALADDLNSAEALRRTHELATGADADTDPERLRAFVETASFLGFRLGTENGPDARLAVEDSSDFVERAAATLDELRAEIDAARAKKDYQRADRIREELRAAGIEVQITKDGAVLERTVDFDPRKVMELNT